MRTGGVSWQFLTQGHAGTVWFPLGNVERVKTGGLFFKSFSRKTIPTQERLLTSSGHDSRTNRKQTFKSYAQSEVSLV